MKKAVALKEVTQHQRLAHPQNPVGEPAAHNIEQSLCRPRGSDHQSCITLGEPQPLGKGGIEVVDHQGVEGAPGG